MIGVTLMDKMEHSMIENVVTDDVVTKIKKIDV